MFMNKFMFAGVVIGIVLMSLPHLWRDLHRVCKTCHKHVKRDYSHEVDITDPRWRMCFTHHTCTNEFCPDFGNKMTVKWELKHVSSWRVWYDGHVRPRYVRLNIEQSVKSLSRTV